MYIVKQQYQCLLGGMFTPSTSSRYEPIPENIENFALASYWISLNMLEIRLNQSQKNIENSKF